MTRSTTTLFCLLGALALAPAASAQHHDMSKHHEAGHDMPRHGGMAMMDADGDGAVTAAEHAAVAQAMFTKADANADGRLTHEEMMAMHQGMRGHMDHAGMKGEGKMACACCSGEGGMQACGMEKKPDAIEKAMSGE